MGGMVFNPPPNWAETASRMESTSRMETRSELAAAASGLGTMAPSGNTSRHRPSLGCVRHNLHRDADNRPVSTKQAMFRTGYDFGIR